MTIYNAYLCRIFVLLGIIYGLVSCKKDKEVVTVTSQKEVLYTEISEKWIVNTQEVNTQTVSFVKDWDAYISLKKELEQKPKASLGAIKQKTTIICKKIENLNGSVPAIFDNPEAKSRMSVLLSKARMLETQVYLDYLKPKQIILKTQELKTDFNALQNQLDRIVTKSNIQFEEGELQMRQELQLQK